MTHSPAHDLRRWRTLVEAMESRELSPAFLRWFGKSVVRDASGHPLIVYHGTASASSIDSFHGMVWASVDPQLANEFASYQADADYTKTKHANVIPLYMKIEHPFDADALGKGKVVSIDSFYATLAAQSSVDVSRLRDALKSCAFEESGLEPHTFWNDHHYPFDEKGLAIIRQSYLTCGFDGIQYTEAGYLTYGAFSPTQVKSIFNTQA